LGLLQAKKRGVRGEEGGEDINTKIEINQILFKEKWIKV
jgi:hypothetical protein